MELLITLGLLALLAVLSINMLAQSPSSANRWGRVANDMVTHLEMACNTVRLSQGTGPFRATKIVATPPVDPSMHQYEYAYTEAGSTEDPDGYQSAAYTSKCPLHTDTATSDGIANTYVCNTLYRGMSIFLPTWESNVKKLTGPERLEYPNDIVLYLRPDEATVADPNSEIPNAGADNTPASFAHDDIMDTVDDREWLLLDMNGTDGPNSIAAGGDRVLLHVDDSSCKILTARQKCKLVNSAGTCNDGAVTTYPQSFYDQNRNYCSNFLDANCPYSDTP